MTRKISRNDGFCLSEQRDRIRKFQFEMEKGYQDYQNGHVRPIETVFEKYESKF